MICTMITYMEKHLPQYKISVFSICERFFE